MSYKRMGWFSSRDTPVSGVDKTRGDGREVEDSRGSTMHRSHLGSRVNFKCHWGTPSLSFITMDGKHYPVTWDHP